MRKDRRGIEGLPLRLMIVALLVSLTLPLLLSSMEQAASGMAERRLGQEAEDLVRSIEGLAAAGPGNVRFMDVATDLPYGSEIRLGGGTGTGESARVSWYMDGAEVGRRYLEGAEVVTADGSPIGLGPGASMVLRCPANIWGVVEAARA